MTFVSTAVSGPVLMVTQADNKDKEKKKIANNRDIFCMGHLYLISFEGLVNVDADIQPG